MTKQYLLTAYGYALIGLLLGIYMAASKDHSQLVAHAHIMLLGFVVSFIYGVTHHLWLDKASAGIHKIQLICHQVGTIVLVLSLFMLYGNILEGKVLGPILGISSMLVLAAMIMMKIQVIKAFKNNA